MSDDFFSFEAFNKCKKLSEQLRRKPSSYRKIVQGAIKLNVGSESEFEYETFDIDAQQHDSDFVKTRKLTMDEPVKTSQTSDEDRVNKVALEELEATEQKCTQEEESRQQHFYERSNFHKVPEVSEVPLDLFDF